MESCFSEVYYMFSWLVNIDFRKSKCRQSENLKTSHRIKFGKGSSFDNSAYFFLIKPSVDIMTKNGNSLNF